MKLTERQAHTLRRIVETHGGCSINGNVAKALERRGLVTLPETWGGARFVPQATDAGKALIAEMTTNHERDTR
jgi:hypothetical protein